VLGAIAGDVIGSVRERLDAELLATVDAFRKTFCVYSTRGARA
jgi:hypothetical protein